MKANITKLNFQVMYFFSQGIEIWEELFTVKCLNFIYIQPGTRLCIDDITYHVITVQSNLKTGHLPPGHLEQDSVSIVLHYQLESEYEDEAQEEKEKLFSRFKRSISAYSSRR